ncbi:lipopolysaccharide kinase InaA family protein [Pseudomonas fontis]|uniref:Lipopolysaccharide kinase InaA family protein n=1 Tax=Pseudomonas fontis TaxID=2942633 RepID=A0ABT5NS97_9PSED|nr:lipopolysaccharide kinase InaA family protein [Pseudomonas fontis]MDD0977118.1 lipopolysaccharide kinase InaA family protein [Pseudomonas fontis]MDD0991044.1 lipopolysaccharide kinase InaA family protein [Pseudomonas fontis]
MTDFLASAETALLERHGLNGFDQLWTLQLDAVDEPNTGRGGWSSVFRLELEGKGYYLKRQSDYLTRTLHRPFGEPTFAREFRNISRYEKLQIPALQAVYYGERKVAGEYRAILMTRALDEWSDLDHLLGEWPQLSLEQRQGILRASGKLARTVHAAGQVHGCFYPKHIFLRERGDGWQAQLIDLEKTRPLIFGMRDRLKDLEPLLRRAPMWSESEVRLMLSAYLEQPADSTLVDTWLQRLLRRRREKEAR